MLSDFETAAVLFLHEALPGCDIDLVAPDRVEGESIGTRIVCVQQLDDYFVIRHYIK